MATRFVGAHAAADVLVDLHGEMRFHLLTEILVGTLAAAKDGADAGDRPPNGPHVDARFIAKKHAIRSAVCCHAWVSRASCLRPAAVSE